MKSQFKDKVPMKRISENLLKECFIHGGLFLDPDAPLGILTFKKGSLHAEFSDCVKSPGIYGSLFMSIELIDSLYIRNGVNDNDVRFVAQFGIDQISLDCVISSGKTISLSSTLTFHL